MQSIKTLRLRQSQGSLTDLFEVVCGAMVAQLSSCGAGPAIVAVDGPLEAPLSAVLDDSDSSDILSDRLSD